MQGQHPVPSSQGTRGFRRWPPFLTIPESPSFFGRPRNSEAWAARPVPRAAAKRFSARVESQGPGGAWSFIGIPFSVEEAWGSRASVKGEMNGAPFRSSVQPFGDGTHHMMANKALLAAAKAQVGDTAQVTMEPDTEERLYAMPKDMAAAVRRDRKAAGWDALPPSARKLYVEWVEGAKREETRAGRVAKAVGLLRDGKRLK